MSTKEGKNITDTLATIGSSENVIDTDLNIHVTFLSHFPEDIYHNAAGVRQVTTVLQSSFLERKKYKLKHNLFVLRWFTLYFVSTVEGLLDATAQPGT